MRPNQPNNNNKQRSRGRNNHNNNNQRRGGGGNPLSRNYESNGPDVKIRGNAAHVAEKYVQLARDATASGDSVMAENYLQHAEHYFRIILAAQAQYQPRPEQFTDTGPDEDEDGENGSVQADDAAPAVVADAQAGEAEAPREPRRNPRQRRPRRDEQDAAPAAEAQPEPAAPEAAPVVEEAAAAPEEKPRRTRRPRRVADADLADAPQPDLPAFITAGRETAAE